MLQKNILTGILFCLGIAINSPTMLLAALIAILTSHISAKLYQYDIVLINNGIYSFNAVLVGIAVWFFLPVSFLSLAIIILGAFLATIISHIMLINSTNIPMFTAPFVISTWCILLGLEATGIATTVDNFTTNDTDDFYTILRGVSQVMFQSYWFSGFIFVVALWVSSYKLAVWAVTGSAVAMLIARALGYSEGTLLIGGYSFNATLVAIALAQQYQVKAYLILLGILLSVLLSQALTMIGVPALTAPFVLASWIIIAINTKITGVYKLP